MWFDEFKAPHKLLIAPVTRINFSHIASRRSSRVAPDSNHFLYRCRPRRLLVMGLLTHRSKKLGANNNVRKPHTAVVKEPPACLTSFPGRRSSEHKPSLYHFHVARQNLQRDFLIMYCRLPSVSSFFTFPNLAFTRCSARSHAILTNCILACASHIHS